jgi:hypothetical protein
MSSKAVKVGPGKVVPVQAARVRRGRSRSGWAVMAGQDLVRWGESGLSSQGEKGRGKS